MKTVLLAGGLPLEPTEGEPRIPPALVEIGGRPIITRVMDIYSHFGQRDFLVAAGYRAILLKQFFANYHMMANDLTVSITASGVELQPVENVSWTVSVADTGVHSTDTGRVRLLRDRIGTSRFMLSHADAVGNVDIDALLDFHRSHGKLATVTAVHPPARENGLHLRGNHVIACASAPQRDEDWINGGFFVLEPGIFDYLVDNGDPQECSPLMQLALDGELMAFRHPGFWHRLESLRDQRFLGDCCAQDTPPWLRFAETAPRPRVSAVW